MAKESFVSNISNNNDNDSYLEYQIKFLRATQCVQIFSGPGKRPRHLMLNGEKPQLDQYSINQMIKELFEYLLTAKILNRHLSEEIP